MLNRLLLGVGKLRVWEAFPENKCYYLKVKPIRKKSLAVLLSRPSAPVIHAAGTKSYVSVVPKDTLSNTLIGVDFLVKKKHFFTLLIPFEGRIRDEIHGVFLLPCNLF